MLRPLMRKTGLVIALLLGSAVLNAQPAASGSAAGATNASTRNIALADAVQMALASNLDIQISRLAPARAQFALTEAYGVYEPRLRFNAEHSFDKSPGGFLGNLQFPSQVTEINTFGGGLGSGLSGYGPYGFSYGIGGSLTKRNSKSSTNLLGGTDDYYGGLTLDLRQPLLQGFLADPERALIQVNRRNIRISEEQLRQRIMDIVLAVEQAYYNLIFARENVRVQSTALELASQLLRENKKRVEVGALAPLDEKQAESEVASTRAALIDAERLLSQQQNVLKSLITDNYSEWNAVNLEPVEALVAVPAAPDLHDSWGRGLRMRADLLQLKYELEKAGINLKLRKNQILPILDITGSYGHSERGASTHLTDILGRLPDGRNPNYSIGGVLEIPIGNISARARYKSAKADKDSALLQYKRLEQQIMVDIDDAVKLIRSNFERVEATRAARAFAQEALAAEQKKLENGKSTSFFVLQFQRDLTVRRSDEIRALADYNNAVALLANREGATLERHHIEIR